MIYSLQSHKNIDVPLMLGALCRGMYPCAPATTKPDRSRQGRSIERLKTGGLFDSVWVTRKIKAKSLVKDLFLVDGSANIDIGYTLQAEQIEPHQQ